MVHQVIFLLQQHKNASISEAAAFMCQCLNPQEKALVIVPADFVGSSFVKEQWL